MIYIKILLLIGLVSSEEYQEGQLVPEIITTSNVYFNQPESSIHKSFNQLLKLYVSNDGRVNYKGFIQDKEKLRTYIQTLGANMPTDHSTKEDLFAFWMNAYNAITIDLIIRNYPVKSIKDIKDPWKQRLWKLGDNEYNLDEIEHQILRKMGDPRIHFGINCASVSCPTLLNEAFTSENVNSQLNALAIKFVNDPIHNTISANEIEISKIFSWFSNDFKQNGTLIDFLNLYSEIKIDSNAKIRYKDYNWNLNE